MADQPKIIDMFEVAIVSEAVKIAEGSQNEAVIRIKRNADDERLVRLTVSANCGRLANALLETKNESIEATSDHPDARKLSKLEVADATKASWQTRSAGIKLTNEGKQISVKMARFRCRTPPGKAKLEVVIEDKARPADTWTEVGSCELEILKAAPEAATLLYFAISPDFVLQAGATDVTVEICAPGFSKLRLTRNNEEVPAWNDECQKMAKGLPAKFPDRPSITTVYHLELTRFGAGQREIREDVYRTVQVISPGWNRLALPQGYPTWLFAANLGQGGRRLYGIFIDSNGKATLHSSATGVDNWQEEGGVVPDRMKNSPGVVFDGKLWLIGGSSFDEDAVGDEVWCYEKRGDTSNWEWKEKAELRLGAHGVGKRACHACITATVQGKEAIWLLGGYDNGICYKDVCICDGAKWTKAAEPAWAPRFKHAAAARRRGSDAELWIYGGLDQNHVALSDLWIYADGNWSPRRGPEPSPGQGKAVTLTTAPPLLPIEDDGGITMLGTFLLPDGDNVTVSRILKWRDGNAIWEAEEVGAGWERFAGAAFGMQAISFNGFLFVWTLHRDIERPPRLNVLVSP
jgi:hypothetical protein